MRTMRANIGILKWMFVLLLVVFGVGLVMPGYMGRKDLATAAAVVDGEPVDAQTYSRALSQALEEEHRRQGGDLSEADTNKIRRDTLNALIDEQLAFAHATTLGQTMSPEEFQKDLLDDPEFKDRQGNFDRTRYERVLQMEAEQGVNWQDAETGFQRNMLLNKVRGFWAAQAALSPLEEKRAVERFNRQVKAEALVWNLEKLRAGIRLSDDDLHSYYSENKKRWVKPEQVKLRQIEVKADFGAPTATARAKAEALLAKVKAGADFKALAAKENSDPDARKAAGDLGWVSPSDLRRAEVATALRGLKKGGVSAVIPTGTGFALLKVEDRKEGFDPTFANTKDKAAHDLGLERAKKQASQLANGALAALAKGKSLEEAAAQFHGQKAVTGWFDRDATKALPGLGDSPSFANEALTLKVGETLSAPVTTDTAVAVARLTDERPGSAPAKAEAAEARAHAAHDEAVAEKADALYKAWIATLRAKAEISDNNGVLASK
jgi:peptidyl-prolyl cis-trans isomerase D